MLDYREAVLASNGLQVTPLTVAGLMAEEAFKASRRRKVRLASVLETDLPSEVLLKLDRRGQTKVKVHEADRSLGLRVARALRLKLHTSGLELVEPCLAVREDGKKLGEHDLVLETVSDGRGLEPGPTHPCGYLSGELKLRRLWSDAGKEKTRMACMVPMALPLCLNSLPAGGIKEQWAPLPLLPLGQSVGCPRGASPENSLSFEVKGHRCQPQDGSEERMRR